MYRHNFCYNHSIALIIWSFLHSISAKLYGGNQRDPHVDCEIVMILIIIIITTDNNSQYPLTLPHIRQWFASRDLLTGGEFVIIQINTSLLQQHKVRGCAWYVKGKIYNYLTHDDCEYYLKKAIISPRQFEFRSGSRDWAGPLSCTH